MRLNFLFQFAKERRLLKLGLVPLLENHECLKINFASEQLGALSIPLSVN